MKKLFFTNLFIALLLIFVVSISAGQPGQSRPPVKPAASGDIYVSTDGSDSSAGTVDRPLKTIQKAAESAAPGSTVYVKAGTYYEKVNIKVSGSSSEAPVVFRNFQDGKVIIDGSHSTDSSQQEIIRIKNKSYILLEGFEITGNGGPSKGDFAAGIGIWGKGEGIQIKNCKIHDIGSVEAAGGLTARGVAVYGRDEKTPIKDLLIGGCEIWNIHCKTGAAVEVSGNVNGFEISNNYIHDNGNTGLALVGDGRLKGDAVCPSSAANRARNGLVAYNKMERNSDGKASAAAPGGAGGIVANGAKDVVIAYNTLTQNDMGLRAENDEKDKLCTGITVRDNLIYGNRFCGIQAGGADIGSGWAVNCRFINNTLYSNNTENLNVGEIYIAKSHDLLISGNIIYTGRQNLAVSMGNFDEKYIYNNSFDNNIYYGPGGSRGLRFSGINTGKIGLYMWRQKTGQDGSSRTADPKFKDMKKNDFTLRSYSPAIDAAGTAYTPESGEKDFGGNPRVVGKAVDCGAYEY